jgi:type 1 fimbria pilin
MRLLRSCSATQLKIATSKFLTGPPVSSQGALTDTTCTPRRSSSSTSVRLPTIDLPNLSSAQATSTSKAPLLASFIIRS